MHSIETGNADFQFQLSILIYLQNIPSSQCVQREWTIKWPNSTELNALHSRADVSLYAKHTQQNYPKFWICIRNLNFCEDLTEIQCENLVRAEDRGPATLNSEWGLTACINLKIKKKKSRVCSGLQMNTGHPAARTGQENELHTFTGDQCLHNGRNSLSPSHSTLLPGAQPWPRHCPGRGPGVSESPGERPGMRKPSVWVLQKGRLFSGGKGEQVGAH